MSKAHDDEYNPRLTDFDLQIVNFIKQLHLERDDMAIIIQQQKREKLDLETELEKIIYKLKTVGNINTYILK